MQVTNDNITWAREEKRVFLRQSLEIKLVGLSVCFVSIVLASADGQADRRGELPTSIDYDGNVIERVEAAGRQDHSHRGVPAGVKSSTCYSKLAPSKGQLPYVHRPRKLMVGGIDFRSNNRQLCLLPSSPPGPARSPIRSGSRGRERLQDGVLLLLRSVRGFGSTRREGPTSIAGVEVHAAV